MPDVVKRENKVTAFIKGSSILVLSNVCLKAINFFLLPLYTGNLTPEMIGVSDSITTLTGIILPLLTMGLDSAFSAFYFEKEDSNRPIKVFTTLTCTFFVLGLIPLCLLFASNPFAKLLFHNTNYAYIIKFAFISVSFNLWFLPYSLELRLKNKMFLFGLSNVISSLSMVILNIIFVSVLHFGESSLVLSSMIVHIENFLILFLFVRTKPGLEWFDSELLKQMLKFAIPLIPMTLMMWILSLSDRYVLLHYHGEIAVGLYGIGLRFTNLMNVVISAVAMAYTTFAFSSKEDENSKQKYYYIFNIESFILIVIAFTISLFGKEIVHLMTSASYDNSYLSLRDLMFAQVFYAMTSIVGYGIYFEKKSYYSLIAVSAGAILNLGLNFLLIPKFGIAAAALTTLLGYMLNYFITLFFSEKVYPCNYGQIKVLCSLLCLYAICYLCGDMLIFIKILIWLICFLIMIFLNRKMLKLLLSFFKSRFIKQKNGMENTDDK